MKTVFPLLHQLIPISRFAGSATEKTLMACKHILISVNLQHKLCFARLFLAPTKTEKILFACPVQFLLLHTKFWFLWGSNFATHAQRLFGVGSVQLYQMAFKMWTPFLWTERKIGRRFGFKKDCSLLVFCTCANTKDPLEWLLHADAGTWIFIVVGAFSVQQKHCCCSKCNLMIYFTAYLECDLQVVQQGQTSSGKHLSLHP